MLKSFNIYAVLKLELYVFGYLMEFLLGGAMKPTTHGQWAHLACAMWIPSLFVYDFIHSFLPSLVIFTKCQDHGHDRYSSILTP